MQLQIKERILSIDHLMQLSNSTKLIICQEAQCVYMTIKELKDEPLHWVYTIFQNERVYLK